MSCLSPRQVIKTLRYEEQFLSTVLNISICLACYGGQQEVPSLKISWYTGTSGLEIFPSWNNKIKYYIITQSGLVHGGTSNHSIFTPAKWFNTSKLSPYFNGFWERKTPDNQFFIIYFSVKNKITVKILQDLQKYADKNYCLHLAQKYAWQHFLFPRSAQFLRSYM